METREYKNIYENEGKHFFYRANHELFLSRVRDLRTKNRRLLKILDAGCGTGLLAKRLKAFGEVTGVDIDTHAILYSKKRGIKVRKGSINSLPFKSRSFDTIVSMDVIYHKRVNDTKALREFFRVLKPGGTPLVRVPALPLLFSSHDQYVHTRERYTKRKLLEKLTQAGFKVRKITYVNSVLFFPTIVKVVFEKIKNSHNAHSGIKRVTLLFGIGLFAVAKKQKNT